MVKDTTPSCDECDQELFQLDGEWFCEACDSVSGFELTPQEDNFRL
jgi:uncharacterized Zn finger protein (UPF0148 family)